MIDLQFLHSLQLRPSQLLFPGITEMILAPSLSAIRLHAGQGSIGRTLPLLPIRHMTIVFTWLPYRPNSRRSAWTAVPALPSGSLSKTSHWLCVLVTCPSTSPCLSNAIAETLNVQELLAALRLSRAFMPRSLDSLELNVTFFLIAFAPKAYRFRACMPPCAQGLKIRGALERRVHVRVCSIPSVAASVVLSN